ncbi:MAG TPA: DUF6443 domain-containing protein [Ohtaekwangia sp.]|uniref:DUF6443 domain-containing protein n=1 Tax=Ohtaekwangia sp. TaxID=2066019 RepID=UPI002F93ED8B
MKKFLLFIPILLLSIQAFSQWTGAATVNSGQTVSYTLAEDAVYTNWSFKVTGGKLNSSSRSGYNYTANITWIGGVAGRIDFYATPTLIDYSLNVTVNGCAYTSPAIPGTPTVSTNTCGDKTITLATQPTGYEWYWVSSATGTETTNRATSSYTVAASGTYYVRSKSGCNATWSSGAASVNITVNPVPSPPASVTNLTVCHGGGGFMSAVPGANGNNINWYTASTGGTPYTALTYPWSDDFGTQSTYTYYVTTTNTANGCESAGARTPVTVTVKSATLPSSAIATNGSKCGPGTINISAAPGANGDQIYWYSASQGGPVIATGSGFTANVSATTTYYATTYSTSTQCESMARTAVVAMVNPIPAASPSPSQTTICSGATASIVLSDPNNAGNTTYSWIAQGSNGTAPADTGTGNISGIFYNSDAVNQGTVTYTITPSTTFCTGTPVTATVTIKNTPVAPNPGPFLILIGSSAPVTFKLAVPAGQQATWYPDGASAVTGPTYQYIFDPKPESYAAVHVSLTDLATSCETAHVLVPFTFTNLIHPNSVTKETVRVTGQLHSPDVDNLNAGQKVKTISFIDGLGRATQVVGVGAATSGKDLVQPVEYDSYGRTSKNYLPYAASTSGTYQNLYPTDQAAFYASDSPQNDKVVNDAYPFAIAKYEASPLGRVLEQGSPGQAWQPGQHTATASYSFNTGATSSDADEVRKFAADGSSTGYYAANTLSKTTAVDENGSIIITYATSGGKTLAVKQQQSGTTYLQTYYIYDDFDRLKYIISPGGLTALKANSWTLTQAIIDNYLHQFVYDNLGRLIQKKTPGQAWSYFAYDNLNRLVLSQDGNLRQQQKWAFRKYDRLGRTVMGGVYINTSLTDQASAQTLLAGLYTSSSTPYYEKPGTTLYGYTNQSFPTTNADNSALEVWTVNYFDSYGFTMNSGSAPVYDNAHLAGLPAAATTNVRGLATGSRSRIIGTTNWIVTAVFYDDNRRPIQVQRNNHLKLTGIDKQSNLYDFEKITQTKVTHSPDGITTTAIVTTPNYDQQGRVSKLYHSINGAASQLVAQYEYNDLGQLVTRKLHGDQTGTSFLQNVDYRYHIRGWLASINNAQLAADPLTSTDTNDYFGMEFSYEAAAGMGNNAYYDGNASAIKWKGSGAANGMAEQRSYKYTYDQAGRLTNATFQKSTASNWTAEQNTLNENATYDVNGNIQTLTRYQNLRGLSGTTTTSTALAIDNLTYTYAAGNQLNKVEDAASATGFTNGKVNGTDEYTYDTNGSLTKDDNKGISSIVYNLQGKASTINFTDGRKIDYVYDASGNKLKMTTTIGSTVTTIDYVGGFMYTNNTLSFIPSPEGRVVKNGSNYEYQYAIADHQGNTRVVFTSAAPAVDSKTASFETPSAEQANFQNYPTGGKLNNTATNNHTTAGTGSLLLNGGYAGLVGVAKSYRVFPGDKLQVDAWGMYRNLSTGSSSQLTQFAGALLSAFSLSAPVAGETGTASAALNTVGGFEAAGYGDGSSDNTHVRAFVNIMLFDKNYKFVDAAYAQLLATSEGVYVSMSKSYTVKEEGYAYMYVSNEDQRLVDVYFDDVAMKYTPSSVVQYNEYYPFGLQTQNSWTRTNASNSYLYDAGSELNNATQLYDLPFRNYDAALGRFHQIDPLASKSHNVTPYHYAGNNPISYNDPTGLLKALDFGKYYSGPSWSLHPGDGDWADTYSGAEGVAAGNPAEGDARAVKEGRMTLADYAAKWGESISPDQVSITNEQGEPIVYNYHCGCWVPAKELLEVDPAVQNAEVRSWAQTAVNAYEQRNAQVQANVALPLGLALEEVLTLLGVTELVAGTHRNDNRNPDLHHVYMIYSKPKGYLRVGVDWKNDANIRVEKFGITSGEGTLAERRPQTQVNGWNSADPTRQYSWIWMNVDLPGTAAARAWEGFYVAQYSALNNGNLPYRQVYPGANWFDVFKLVKPF